MRSNAASGLTRPIVQAATIDAAAELAKVVQEHRRLWGPLPFRKYVFLCVVREKGGGGGGLEHANSALLFTSAARKMAPRDRYLGWSEAVRPHNLCRVVNNSRFLILPWVRVEGLAFSILARAASQLTDDWRQHYGYKPMLLETLVDPVRFLGTCYRAANWICVGETSGRGRMDRHHRTGIAKKTIFVFPLCHHVQRALCMSDPPPVPIADP